MSLRQALVEIHRPTSPSTLERARLRLKFEELFYIQVDMLLRARTFDMAPFAELLTLPQDTVTFRGKQGGIYSSTILQA